VLREQNFDTGEALLNFAVGPASGLPLLLLHGVTRRWHDFLTLMPCLMARWQVFALDFRGHGQSARCPGGYRVVNYLRDAAAFLREQVRAPAIVFGHSLGAMVAAGIAAELPELVRAVVLEDPPFSTLGVKIQQTPFYMQFAGMHKLAHTRGSVDEMARALANLPVHRPGDGEIVRLGQLRDATSLRFTAKCLTLADPDVLSPIVEGHWLDGYDQERVLRRVTCPALLLKGDYACGGMLVDREAELATSLMANCTRIDFPGVGHLIHYMQPETTLRLLTGFLESL
jgi:pimeloyl-ACP methyl ester carboxylesterase